MSNHSLKDQVAIVTGANDPDGLGFGIAKRLADDGAAVYFGCRKEEQAVGLAKHLPAPSARALVIDVADPESIARALLRIESESGRLDILVNNAGDGANCAAMDETAAQWDRIHAANARGPFLVSQAAARIMLKRGYGRIVSISSQAGTVAIKNHIAYSSSKAALDMMTKSLALELAPTGITVNAVGPTYLLTRGTQASLADPAFKESVLSRIPIGRLGTIADVAHAVRFLADPSSSLITGQTLLLDGGWTLA